MPRRFALSLAVPAVLGLGLAVAQVALPGMAAQRIRAQLARHGTVLQVGVRAFPAIELLWHRADAVRIRLASYRATSQDLRALIDQTGQAASLRASSQLVTDGRLTLRRAALIKTGHALRASALVMEGDVRAAGFGLLRSLTPVASPPGQLVLRGALWPLGIHVDAIVSAQQGWLVANLGLPLLGPIVLFSAPHVHVNSVGARRVRGGFEVFASAHLD